MTGSAAGGPRPRWVAMRRVLVRSVWAHRRRLLSTVLAVVIGVGFMGGTLILATTIHRVSGDLFKGSASSIDALVQGRPVSNPSIGAAARADLSPATVARVRDVPGVAAAAPRVSTTGTQGTNIILGRFGDPLGPNIGPATVFENWVSDPRLTPYRIDAGRAPRLDGEIALDAAALDASGAAIGQQLLVVSQFGPRPYTVVGSFTVGLAESTDGGVAVEFTLPEAQRLAGTNGQIDSVLVRAARGVSPSALVTRLREALPGTDVITGKQAVAQLSQGAPPELGFLRAILVVFGVIAVRVGAFVISNTFAILVAQRSQELALLRVLGASRVQLFAAVLLEAVVVGAVGSALGVAFGTQLARWINWGLGQIGAEVPHRALVVSPATVGISLAVGVSVTVLAALVPALRATAVAPVSALQTTTADRRPPSGRRVQIGLAAIAVGALGCSEAWTRRGASGAVPVVGVGAVLVVAGVVLVGPPLAGHLLARSRRVLRRWKGVVGTVASEHAARSPRRTSALAATVLISVVLVVFVSAFAASAARSLKSDVRRGVDADFVLAGVGGITLPNGLLANPIPPTVVDTVRAVPGVRLAVAMSFASARIGYPDGSAGTSFVTAIDEPGLGTVLRPRMSRGDIAALDDDGIVVDRLIAHDHHLSIGDRLTYRVGAGPRFRLRVAAISDDPNLLGYFTVTRRIYALAAPQVSDIRVAGLVEPGADIQEVLGRIRAATIATPAVVAYDREAYIGNLDREVRAFTNLIYGLLVLSVLISVVGIANTLTLTVHERTRELSLLRALGMDRAGIRSAVRWEVALIAGVAMVVGVGAGAGLSLAVIRSLRGFGLVVFTIAPAAVAVTGLGAVALATLAAVRPARRASELGLLEGIATP